MMHYSCKMIWWCNNYNLKYFAENQSSNLHSIIKSLYAIIHQLSTNAAISASTIIVRKTHLTADLCIYKVVLYLFYIKQLFTNTFFPLSNKGYWYACVCKLVALWRRWQKSAKKQAFKLVSFIRHFYIA